MFELRSTKAYRTSYKRISQYRNFKKSTLDFVVNTLRGGRKLPAQYRDHALAGSFVGCRECHIQNDLLLVYQKQDDMLILLLVDIGSHVSLFE